MLKVLFRTIFLRVHITMSYQLKHSNSLLFCVFITSTGAPTQHMRWIVAYGRITFVQPLTHGLCCWDLCSILRSLPQVRCPSPWLKL